MVPAFVAATALLGQGRLPEAPDAICRFARLKAPVSSSEHYSTCEKPSVSEGCLAAVLDRE